MLKVNLKVGEYKNNSYKESVYRGGAAGVSVDVDVADATDRHSRVGVGMNGTATAGWLWPRVRSG